MKKYLMSLIVVVVIAAISVGVLLGKIEKLEMEKAALETELASTQALLETALAERDAYEAQLTALETEHTAVKTERDALLAEKEQLSSDLATLTADYQTLNTSYVAAQTTIAELQGYKEQVNTLETQLAEAIAKADALSVQNADLLLQIETANTSITMLEMQIDQLKGRIAILREQMKSR